MTIIEILLRIVAFVTGTAIVIYTLKSATGQFVVPRSTPDSITRFVFRRTRRFFNFLLWIRKARTYEQRDAIMAFYAPVSLLLMPTAWLTCILTGFMLVYRALGIQAWEEAFKLSGSSMLTLGFSASENFIMQIVIFIEALVGLVLVALLIAYLPTMYSAFSRREAAVALLEVRAGSPPFVLDMLARAHRLGRMEHLREAWAQWELWFAEIEESHTSLAALTFFRSPRPERSWITAAGAVLDTASFYASTVDLPRDFQAELCIRAGYLALRQIASFFYVDYNPDPKPTDPISIMRSEWDEVYDQLTKLGVPLKADRDTAWRDFVGWRVNYDTVLLALAALTMAPYAPWSSDRSTLRFRNARRGNPARDFLKPREKVTQLPG